MDGTGSSERNIYLSGARLTVNSIRWKEDHHSTVIDTTFAVVKRKPEKNQACTGFKPYDFCNTGAVL